MPFSVSVDTDQDWSVVRVSGELDLLTAPRVRRTLFDLVSEGHRRIAASIADVTFMDSSGLATLIDTLRVLEEDDGTLALVGTPEHVVRLLRTTGLDKTFTSYASLEALKASSDPA
jgi:anti-sigma B factor antagonist